MLRIQDRAHVTYCGYNSFEPQNVYQLLNKAERIGLPVASLVTHRFPLDQIQEAFEVNLRQEGAKVLVEL